MNEIFSKIFDVLDEQIFICNTEGDILVFNRRCEEFYNRQKAEMINSNINQCQDSICCIMANQILKQKKEKTIIKEFENGKQVSLKGIPLYNNGEFEYILVLGQDITGIEEMENQLEKYKKEQAKVKKQIEKYELMEKNYPELVYSSAEMKHIMELVEKLAQIDSPVLILGDTGVGKTLIAEIIHKLSPRSVGPFVKVNCGTLPDNLLESELFGYVEGAFTGAKKSGKEGLIARAEGGTIFLDEIGEIPVNLQVKLLNFCQDKVYKKVGGVDELIADVRIIAATNQDLKEQVEKKEFREDLYYRLNVFPIEIAPLRERSKDIIPLLYFYLEKYNKKYNNNKHFSNEVIDKLLNYSWPGNIRELKNLIERLVVTVSRNEIEVQDLPQKISGLNLEDGDVIIGPNKIVPLKESKKILEKNLLKLAKEKYTTTYEIADALKIDQSTVVKKLKKYFND